MSLCASAVPRGSITGLLHCVSLALATAAGVSWFAVPGVAPAATVLMISIDGLKSEYRVEAEHGSLQIPYLRILAICGYAQ
jgi:hypothetical protein